MTEMRDERARGNGRPFLRRVLISRDEPRLRAAWRLTIHALMAVTAVLVFTIVAAIIGGDMLAEADSSWALAYVTLPVALGVTLATWAARRLLDHRSFASLGLSITPRAWRDLGVGLLLGAGMVGVVFVALWASGWLAVDGWAGETTPTGALVAGVLGEVIFFGLVGYYEELLSRGYQFANLADGLGIGWAVTLTSVSFALLHLGNPEAGLASVAGILAAGLLFAYARLRTGLLWMPIGIHVAWNLALGLLGLPVSGIRVLALLSLRVTGPVWATGGAFGPEAGALAPPALLLGALVVRAYARNRGAPNLV